MPPRLINSNCQKKNNLKTGGPPRLINILAYPRINQPPILKSMFLSNNFYFQFLLFPIPFILKV